MAKLIGTAGHVDHGKTTLIQALTGIDPDRLPEEKKRGMTIDIGFAFIDLPKSGRASIVDVPGHEKFLTNMLVGALGIDVALLCVAADEGVKPQTREHLSFLELLPVDLLVVAMTRADLADADTRELSQMDVDELVAKSRFNRVPIVAVSATTCEGLEELKQLLDEALERAGQKDSGPWYLPVDRAFTMKGYGAVVTGTLANGNVSVGDDAILQPGDLKVRIRGIQSHSETLETAEPGRRVALNLSGVKVEDLHRGQVIGRPGSVFESSIIDAKVRIVGELKHGMRIRASIGAEEAIGKAFLSEKEPEIVQLRLETPVACVVGQPIIIRRYSPPTLLAGGRIAVPQAKKRTKKESAQIVEANSGLDDSILNALRAAVAGVKTEEICRRLGRSPQDLGSVFEALQAKGLIAGFAGLWFHATQLEIAKTRFCAALDELHVQKPMVGDHSRELVAQKAGFQWSGKPLDRLIQRWDQEGAIVANGTLVRMAAFQLQLSPKQREFLDRVKAVILERGINTPSPHELMQIVHTPPQAVDEILRLGIAAGELVKVDEGVIYDRQWLERFKSVMFDKYALTPFSAAEFRDAFETSRKYVIPLLEHFDAQGFTVRIGDRRAIRRELES